MSDPFRQLASFLTRAEELLERIEPLLPPASPLPDWDLASAFRWRTRRGVGYLQPIARLPAIRLTDLQDIDEQRRGSTPTRAILSPASRRTTCCSPGRVDRE